MTAGSPLHSMWGCLAALTPHPNATSMGQDTDPPIQALLGLPAAQFSQHLLLSDGAQPDSPPLYSYPDASPLAPFLGTHLGFTTNC